MKCVEELFMFAQLNLVSQCLTCWSCLGIWGFCVAARVCLKKAETILQGQQPGILECVGTGIRVTVNSWAISMEKQPAKLQQHGLALFRAMCYLYFSQGTQYRSWTTFRSLSCTDSRQSDPWRWCICYLPLSLCYRRQRPTTLNRGCCNLSRFGNGREIHALR